MDNNVVSAAVKCSLFVFSHQDDEFGVLHAISDELHNKRDVWCIYFTDGGAQVQRRNQESIRALKKLGVQKQRVLFQGQVLGIKDGELVENMVKATHWFIPFMRMLGEVESVYAPAWEGGHPDHDALHAIACISMIEMGQLGRVRQFSLYNAYKQRAPFFRVMSPLEENGHVEQKRIPVSDRIKYISICLGYPSQAISWVGLYPFVAYNYCFVGKQCIQAVCLERLKRRPHEGSLYYEQRGFSTWREVRTSIEDYLSYSGW